MKISEIIKTEFALVTLTPQNDKTFNLIFAQDLQFFLL